MILIGFFLCHRSRSQSTEGINSSRFLSWSVKHRYYLGEKLCWCDTAQEPKSSLMEKGSSRKGADYTFNSSEGAPGIIFWGPPGLSSSSESCQRASLSFLRLFSKASSPRESGTSHGPDHPKPRLPPHTSDYHPLKTGKEHLVAAYHDHMEVCLDFPPQESTRIQGGLQLA